jgi:anti-sigma factor RsiW
VSELNIHPEAEQLEAYIERMLDDGQRAVMESHLVGCERCRSELDDWLALFAALTSLPPIEPSADFADRVMAGVRLAPSPGSVRALARWAPRTTTGWSLVAAFLALPVVGLAAITAWVLAQPWASVLTAEAVLVYGASRLASVGTWVAAQARALVLGTGAFATAAEALARFVTTTGARGLGLAAAGFCFAALVSTWVLYHYLLRNSSRETRYAPYTI